MSQRKAAGFSISVIARFSYTLSALDVHCIAYDLYLQWVFAMFVHIRQRVREQANT